MSTILQHWHVSISGQATRIAANSNAKVTPKTAYTWVHLDARDPATKQWLVEDPKIDSLATDTMLAADSRPRTITHDGCLLINLRGVNLNEGSHVTDMIGIRFVVEEKRIVSIERRPLKAISDIANHLDTAEAPPTTGAFLALFALLITERMTPTITELSEKVDNLEHIGDTDIEELDRSVLASLRRDIISLRRYLSPQRDALNSFTLQSLKWITERDRLAMRSAADQATRITEELDTLRERCTVIRDHLTDHRAETMNQNMMILSVVAAVFLPLGLISGMMGINVGGMPWVDNAMGFWFVTGIVAVCGVTQFLVFKLVKWI